MKIKIEFEATLEPKSSLSVLELINIWLFNQCDTTLEIDDPNNGEVAGEMVILYQENFKVEVIE